MAYTAIFELLLRERDVLRDRIGRLQDELAASGEEINNLREGITNAIRLEWFGDPVHGRVCPDDKDIIAACQQLERENRCRPGV